ncbi:MAG: hypothetical protein HY581_03490 [Nitrospirae bacterium]|nr:hypothetical protein [Nitrospirota bacterium]
MALTGSASTNAAAGLGTLEQLAAATDQELRETAGVDAKTAAEIRKALG